MWRLQTKNLMHFWSLKKVIFGKCYLKTSSYLSTLLKCLNIYVHDLNVYKRLGIFLLDPVHNSALNSKHFDVSDTFPHKIVTPQPIIETQKLPLLLLIFLFFIKTFNGYNFWDILFNISKIRITNFILKLG